MTEIPQVTLQDAQEVKIEPPKPDQTARDEAAFFDYQQKMQNAQLGWIGRIWGSRHEKPGNVSAIIAIILTAYLGFMIFYFSESPLFGDIFSGLTSIVTLILGYLFGSSDRSS